MDPATGLEVYKTYGVAGLFIVMYLATIWLFIADLKSQREKFAEMTKQMVEALNSSAMANIKTSDILSEVKKSLDENSNKMSEFIAYLRGRDEGD